jgi:tetratricopeptide (TPR) repeat protein
LTHPQSKGVKTFPLRHENRTVDTVGPGQVLRALVVNGDRIWVSRGRPGWVRSTDVIGLDRADEFFSRRLAAGASADNYLARGTVRIAKAKHHEGIADLTKAVELTGSSREYLEPLGFAQLAVHDQVSALETFTRVLRDAPDSAPALMGRGLANYQVGNHQGALNDLSKAIELEPQHAFPRKYLGALLHDLGKLQAARKQLDEAIKIDAYDVFARKAKGRLLFDLFEYEQAEREFAVAMTLDAADVEAIVGRGVVRHAIGTNLPGAASDFEKALQLSDASDDTAYLWSNLGQVQMELGHDDQAMRSFDQALTADPTFSEALSRRAYLRITQLPRDPEAVRLAMADVNAAFKTSGPRTFWDYRAAAAVNAVIGDFSRAARQQTQAESNVRKTGPPRFIESAVATRERYEQRWEERNSVGPTGPRTQ